MKYPNTFLIGAPKCGTTSIANWLSQHPNVFFSRNKEPDFFYNYSGNKYAFEEYLRNFYNASDGHMIVAEGSVWYLFSLEAVALIEKHFPNSKFIVCLRNPVDMAISLHAQKVYTGHELEQDFERAWGLSDRRARGGFDKVFNLEGGDPAHMAYQTACLLGEQVEKLLSLVPEDRVKFIVMDDIRSSPRSVWSSLESFLYLPHYKDVKFKHENKATKRRFLKLHHGLMLLSKLKKKLGITINTGFFTSVHRLNHASAPYERPSETLISEMKSYYASDVRKLSSLIGRDLSAWVEE